MLYQLPLAPRYSELGDDRLKAGIREFKARLGKRLVILGHHYQQDDVIEFSDITGDSLKLSMLAAEQRDAEYIVFCGVHFMAESADILAADHQRVILPDLSAGCSMADMAHIDQVEEAWPLLEQWAGCPITPITYVNSSAAVKAFVGRHDGACCTSSNARMVMEWALHGATPPPPPVPAVYAACVNVTARADAHDAGPLPGAAGQGSAVVPVATRPPTGHKVMFLPDQHLGRNTAYALGWPLDQMVVYDPKLPEGGLTREQVRHARVLLWKGHCSVHQLFNTKQIAAIRFMPQPYRVLVHPECSWEVCQQADFVGSTEYIIKTVREAPAGSHWAVGTEVHLVQRLAKQNPDRHVRSLAAIQCLCTTMYRIDLKHLYWTLENIVEGRAVNQIEVDVDTRHWAKIALDRMLALRPDQPVSAR